MNERYYQLLGESSVSDDSAQAYAESNDLVVPPSKLDVKRYTEAVIRECCIALEPAIGDMISRGQARDTILTHWGIDPREISTLMLDRTIAQLTAQLKARD